MDKDNFKTGDIIWVELYGDSHVQNGIRPCVIIQNDIGNYYSPTIQVVPLTSKKTKTKLPTHVKIPANTAGLRKDSVAMCEGIRLISKVNIKGYIGNLPEEYMAQLTIAMMINIPMLRYLSQEELHSVYKKALAN